MSEVKQIQINRIDSSSANAFVRRHHYSGKVASNSQLHFGAFLNGQLHGVMSFGPSLDKSKIQGLVAGTGWNEFIELNRMAFDEKLPRNSESRCISIALKLIRKNCPQIKWIISFADGTQCGDGTIYRASGFVLTGIKKNTTIWQAPDGTIATDLSLRLGMRSSATRVSRQSMTMHKTQHFNGAASMKTFKDAGYKPLPGFQLRYIYFLDRSYIQKLAVPILPFSKIAEMGAAMYKGKNIQRVGSLAAEQPGIIHPAGGGSIPTPTLQNSNEGGSDESA